MSEKNRVYEIAKAHGLNSKAILDLLQELGVVAKSHMSVLSDEDTEMVEKHFANLAAQGERVVEKAQRVEVEKGRAHGQRLSAREKLEARRIEKERERKSAATAKTPAAASTAPADVESPAAAATPESAAAPEAERKRLKKVTAFKPAGTPAPAPEQGAEPTRGADEPRGAAQPPAGPTPVPHAPLPQPTRPAQRVDLTVIARAAAKTRERIADDMRTRMAEPQPARPPRPKPTETPRPAPRAASAPVDESQPRAIDPNAIRSSVRKALGDLNMTRTERGGRGEGPQGGVPARGGRRKGRASVREERRMKVERHRAREEALQVKENELRITEYISLQELAEKLGVKPQELIMKLMGLGVMATINQRLVREQIEMLVADFEDIEIHWLDTAAGEDIEAHDAAEDGAVVARPPVVTVMGHVDHGKTTLLDFLRKTSVTAGEVGGITQHIGAYQVETQRGRITFLDTPGHEAFTAMRARGARVTDIVVVVVAADDKVMPQTVEAIDHARASNCPIIIAVNKIDLPAADPDGVKQQLMRHNVLVEEYGGEVQAIEISAKKGINIDALLEAISLQSELMELKAVADGRARGTVVEARKDIGRGPVFTVLVSRGTLRVGDPFVVGTVDGRVRALLDEFDKPVEFAGPARPVLVLGASDVPAAGDQMDVVHSDSEAKDIARKRQVLAREQLLHAPKKKATLESLFERMQAQEDAVELNLLVKGDVSGSVEAVCDALMNLSNDKVVVNIIHRSVGAINENDVMLAAASEAVIIGFHLRPDPATRQFAKSQNVDLKLYDIIYEAVDDVRAAMKGLLAPIDKEVSLGSAEVRELFRVPKIGVIAGSYVLEGEIRRNGRVRVVRDQVPIYDGIVKSLKRFKEDARSVASGYECGIGIENFDDLKIGDIFEAYEIQQIAQEM